MDPLPPSPLRSSNALPPPPPPSCAFPRPLSQMSPSDEHLGPSKSKPSSASASEARTAVPPVVWMEDARGQGSMYNLKHQQSELLYDMELEELGSARTDGGTPRQVPWVEGGGRRAICRRTSALVERQGQKGDKGRRGKGGGGGHLGIYWNGWQPSDEGGGGGCREERVTVQGPVKEQQADGMPHGGLHRPPLGPDFTLGKHEVYPPPPCGSTALSKHRDPV